MEKEDKKYLISIIIPICNNPNYFQKVISAVLNQTHSNVEIIIVDDSDKENLEMDRQHIELFNDCRIKHIIRKDKKGPFYAMNVGMKNTTGQFVAFLYDDIQWLAEGKPKFNGLLKMFTSSIDKIKGA